MKIIILIIINKNNKNKLNVNNLILVCAVSACRAVWFSQLKS